MGHNCHVAEPIRYRLPAFAELVGIEILEANTEHVVGRIVLGPQHSNGRDRVHGGAIMTLADTLGAIATVLNLQPDTVTTTIESKTNFLAAGRGACLNGVWPSSPDGFLLGSTLSGPECAPPHSCSIREHEG